MHCSVHIHFLVNTKYQLTLSFNQIVLNVKYKQLFLFGNKRLCIVLE